ncbi:MAG: alpha/beta hydrolase [Bacteroidota bacterium]|nr:alpha/beta hydrolase [Bacteroidota bacterium]
MNNRLVPMESPCAYHDEGKGLPLVFLHAFPLNASMWEPQAHALSGSFRVLRCDLPGFGESLPFEGACSMDRCADCVAAVLDTLRIDRAVLVGSSMGGYVSLAFAALYPSRLAGLVLAGTRAEADPPEARARRRSLAADIRARGIDPLVETLLPSLLSPVSIERDPSLRTRVERIMRAAPPESAAVMLEAMAERPDRRTTLGGCTAPVCIVVGENDALTPPEHAHVMASLAPHAELHVFPHTGHLVNLEAPERFNAVLAAFASNIPFG